MLPTFLPNSSISTELNTAMAGTGAQPAFVQLEGENQSGVIQVTLTGPVATEMAADKKTLLILALVAVGIYFIVR